MVLLVSTAAVWYSHMTPNRAQCMLGRPSSHDYAIRLDSRPNGSLLLIRSHSLFSSFYIRVSHFTLFFNPFICFLCCNFSKMNKKRKQIKSDLPNKTSWSVATNWANLPNCWRVMTVYQVVCLHWMGADTGDVLPSCGKKKKKIFNSTVISELCIFLWRTNK